MALAACSKCLFVFAFLLNPRHVISADECAGVFSGSAVVDLCPYNWPGKRAGRLWLVLFHAPWCGHCQEMHGKYVRLAQEFVIRPGVAIGAIDCNNEQHHSLCRRYNIVGYPTLRALSSGKVVASYDGARETDALSRWLLGVLHRFGGSANCPRGLIGSRSNIVPLCQAHFPGSNARHAWFLVYYDHIDGEIPAALEKFADDVENARGPWREQLRELSQKYDLRLSMPSAGDASAGGPLMKIGAICCDCDGVGDVGPHCEYGAARPMLAWFGRGRRWPGDLVDTSRVAAATLASSRRLAELALEALGARRSQARKRRRDGEL